jgi:uncharacterized membrane protein SpoIIM required for sporulation/ABC-type transport system involved in multi-copper enzyme maturation permease subunit
MLDSLRLTWLVAQRELRDQLRDWRILTPLLILTISFPLIMNEVAHEAVGYVNRYGGNLVVDRLVPFSILIIGFFPITISLVVALESFVGEKERGTIEPLLSSPLQDWQMYFGKLLVGMLTPLLASYISISLYILIVSRQGLHMPDWSVFLQLYLLTGAHAVLMVSAAIVISVQSTSVRAANLLASFIVLPVAFLMQGESVLLFWGTNQVLWLAVAAVLIMAVLLVRVGIAHFHREYLLGREFDTLSPRWIGKFFWASFKGQATSLRSWYRLEVGRVLRQSRVPLGLVVLLALAGYLLSYYWVLVNVPHLLAQASTSDVSAIAHNAGQLAGLAQIGDKFSAVAIFGQNVRVTLLIFLGGVLSFSVLGILALLANIGLLGGVLGLSKMLGLSPWLLFAAGVLPHGIFELPATLLATAVMLRMGAALVTPQWGRSIGERTLELIADWFKVFVGLVVPLLAVGSVIEAYVTPRLLLLVLHSVLPQTSTFILKWMHYA